MAEEEDDYGEAPYEWSQYIYQGANERRKFSLFDNQNTIDIPKFDPCVIRVRRGRQSAVIEPDAGCSVRIYLEGGSDFPRIRLRLIVGKAQDPVHDTSVFFRPWTHDGNTVDRSEARPGTQQPSHETFSFSDQLSQMKFIVNLNLDDETRIKYASVFGANEPAKLSWSYRDPVGFNTLTNIDHLEDDHRTKVIGFRRLLEANDVDVLTRASLKLKESYNFFVSQPTPTPPHFHRWAKRVRRNQPAVVEMPYPVPRSDLETMFRKREAGWADQPPGIWQTSNEISHMPAPIRYIDERQYEVFKKGDIFREVQGQLERRSSWNGRYDFEFRPYLTASHVADRSYLVSLSLRGNLEELPPPPEPGTQVEIEVKLHTAGPSEKFSGKVIPGTFGDTEYDIGMVVTRPEGSRGFVLQELEGRFRFGPQGEPTKQMISGINRVLYGGNGVRPNNWLKDILLNRDSAWGRGPILRPYEFDEFLAHERLNHGQVEALTNAICIPTGMQSRVSIIQGSPGTGKTDLLCRILRYFLKQRINILFVAASNKAVDVAANKFIEQSQEAAESTDGVYRLKVDALERMTTDPELRDREDDDDWKEGGQRDELPGGPPQSPPPYPIDHVDLVIQSSLKQYLEGQLSGTSADTLSLAKHILSRYKVICDRPPGFRPRAAEANEHNLMRSLISARARCEDWVPLQTAGTLDEQNNLIKNFNSVWLEMQKYYIMRARLIFATTAVASCKACRVFRVKVAVVDEASQMRELECVGAVARHLIPNRLEKIILVGDPNQLPPCVLVKLSEFFKSTCLPLQTRLLQSGFEYNMLNIQYRMHPDIAFCIHRLFYNDNVRSEPSTIGRPDALLFERWAEGTLGVKHQSIFVNCTGQRQLYRERQGHSVANPESAAAVVSLIESMIRYGITTEKIRVLTPYAAQQRLLRLIFRSMQLAISVSTIDGSQGDEVPICILDLMVHGGSNYPMGFVRDTNRMNVGLSRARDGLVVVGYDGMTHHQHTSRGVEAWRFLIQHHKEGGWGANTNADDAWIRRRFGIPGTRYEAVPRRGT